MAARAALAERPKSAENGTSASHASDLSYEACSGILVTSCSACRCSTVEYTAQLGNWAHLVRPYGLKGYRAAPSSPPGGATPLPRCASGAMLWVDLRTRPRY